MSMNQSEQDIEGVLRRAPAPRPGRELEGALLSAWRESREASAGARRSGNEFSPRRGERSFLGRWWPTLLPGVAVAVLGGVVAVQQAELGRLRQETVFRAGGGTGGSEPGAEVGPVLGRSPATAAGAVAIAAEEAGAEAELERLRALARTLHAEVEELEALRTESARLRAEIAAAKSRLPPEVQEMDAVKERAERIKCVNNLKQLGLAVRIWANDNRDDFPPDYFCLTNEIPNPAIFVCPGDPARVAAPNMASLTPSNVSYEFLAPGPGDHLEEPTRVAWRCPIHRNVTLVDGSVQQLTQERYDGLETRGGKLYLPPAPVPAPKPEAQPQEPSRP